MDVFLSDLRYGLRSLRNHPGFSFVAVLTLALGIGANTAIFSLISGAILKPLPYHQPDRIVQVWNRYEDKTHASLAWPEFTNYRRRSRSFSSMSAYGFGEANLTGQGAALRVAGVYASAEIFDVLGIEPSFGRGYTSAEDRPSASAVVVLGYELWQSAFAGDPQVVGQSILLDDIPHQVLGVMPRGARMPEDFATGNRTQVWFPLGLDPDQPGDWGMHGLSALARLRPGVSLTQAQSELDVVVQQIKEEHPEVDDALSLPSFGASVFSMSGEVVGDFRVALLILMAAVAAVLLIACTNIANLSLARGQTRRRELALRSALGARRGRLLRQLLTENLILAGLSGAAGLLLAYWALDLIRMLNPGNIPRLAEVVIDLPVLGFNIVIALVTGLTFGLLPAFHNTSFQLQGTFRDNDSRGGTTRRRRLRQLLIVGETALAVVLVVGAGLLLKSFWLLQGVEPGFRTHNLLTLELEVPRQAYPENSQVAGFFQQLRRRIESLPGVERVGAVTGLPLASRRGDWNFHIEGRPPRKSGERSPRGDWQVVTPGYFQAMGVPLIAGRGFSDSDDEQAPTVILVNQALASKYWPDASPIGHRIRLGGNDANPWTMVVGVVGDVRHRGLDGPPRPEWYLNLAQTSKAMGIPVRRRLALVIRPQETFQARGLLDAVRTEIRQLDDQLPLSAVRTVEQIRSDSLSQPRFSMVLLSLFALLALLLGAVGVYGVTSFAVSRRTREIGVRMALGARPLGIVGGVVGQGVLLTLIGIGIGLTVSLATTRLLRGLLFEVQPHDLSTFALVAFVMLLVGGVASYWPARRAASVDPISALRQE